MHYSDCNCKLGNFRKALCYQYTVGKDAGFGFLGVVLGILTSVGLYVLYMCLLSNALGKNDGQSFFDLFHNKVSPEEDEISKTFYKENATNDGKAEAEVSTAEPETVDIKQMHDCDCWVCDVKRNRSEPPLYYIQDVRVYKDGTRSHSCRHKHVK